MVDYLADRTVRGENILVPVPRTGGPSIEAGNKD